MLVVRPYAKSPEEFNSTLRVHTDGYSSVWYLLKAEGVLNIRNERSSYMGSVGAHQSRWSTPLSPWQFSPVGKAELAHKINGILHVYIPIYIMFS